MEDYSNERLEAAEELLYEGDEDAKWLWNRAGKMAELALLKLIRVVLG